MTLLVTTVRKSVATIGLELTYRYLIFQLYRLGLGTQLISIGIPNVSETPLSTLYIYVGTRVPICGALFKKILIHLFCMRR